MQGCAHSYHESSQYKVVVTQTQMRKGGNKTVDLYTIRDLNACCKRQSSDTTWSDSWHFQDGQTVTSDDSQVRLNCFDMQAISVIRACFSILYVAFGDNTTPNLASLPFNGFVASRVGLDSSVYCVSTDCD